MNILAIDTSEARGSVSFVRDGETMISVRHDTNADYSEWLLPAVEELLRASSVRMEDLDLVAVSAGPGSFTGLRVGMTTVKAWAEVYRKPIVAVSRLEAMARSSKARGGFVAACYDAQRGQVFGSLYRACGGQLTRLEDEMAIAPDDFLKWVVEQAGAESVCWVSLDPELITGLRDWPRRKERGDTVVQCSAELASAIGRLGAERAASGAFSNALELDANYVRRSDAEIFWKAR